MLYTVAANIPGHPAHGRGNHKASTTGVSLLCVVSQTGPHGTLVGLALLIFLSPNPHLLGLLPDTTVVGMVENTPRLDVRLCCFQKVAVPL